MGNTVTYDLFVNLRKETPQGVVCMLNSLVGDSGSWINSGYHYPCGKPVVDFYLDQDRPNDYHHSDGSYYLRVCNGYNGASSEYLKNLLRDLAPWVVDLYGDRRVGFAVDGSNKYYIVSVRGDEIIIDRLSRQ